MPDEQAVPPERDFGHHVMIQILGKDALEVFFTERLAVVAQHLEPPLRRVGKRGRSLDVAVGEMAQHERGGWPCAVRRAGFDEPLLCEAWRYRTNQKQGQTPFQAAARCAVDPAS